MLYTIINSLKVQKPFHSPVFIPDSSITLDSKDENSQKSLKCALVTLCSQPKRTIAHYTAVCYSLKAIENIILKKWGYRDQSDNRRYNGITA